MCLEQLNQKTHGRKEKNAYPKCEKEEWMTIHPDFPNVSACEEHWNEIVTDVAKSFTDKNFILTDKYELNK